jgi:hypothetical protein
MAGYFERSETFQTAHVHGPLTDFIKINFTWLSAEEFFI